ncbi:scavenger receptor cysteine-rich type 1 protein M130-like [Strongylocentrotus purpuratus]|uniref:SRCR domain-containing protein n=1 Tax=Strongylocentrotus purpuratus TaxID=7668 RepID=A0A7M7NPT1_STRPU|nr:scavenger receptor cysteine-rich type 1 protein M130-like [Strongylocentrotus purpuratus]
MLGYERAENFSCCAAFGLGSGLIVLDEVECEGTEPNIGHCRRSGYETHDCDHSEDVGVSCIENEVEQESSTTMTPNGSKMGLSQPATFGLIGFLSVTVIGTLLGCIVMTVMMRKYRRSANKASSQQQGTVEHHCYNGEEGYLELNVVPPKLQGGSSRDQDEAYETPRHADDEDSYEDVKI